MYCGATGPVTARFFAAGSLSQERRFDPPTRCQIQVLGCPRNPETPGVFNDEWQHSDTDEAKCLERANEFYAYCGGPDAVTARFLKGNTVSNERRVDPPTHCQITVAACPRNPDTVGTFNDDYEHAGSDLDRCMRRGKEFFTYCGGPPPVTARYFKGAAALREERIDPPSRCEVTVPECPKNAATVGTFNDDWENAGADEGRCQRRAADFVAYCGATKPAIARFFRGAALVSEKSSDAAASAPGAAAQVPAPGPPPVPPQEGSCLCSGAGARGASNAPWCVALAAVFAAITRRRREDGIVAGRGGDHGG
jgi:hypothetical protein